MTSKLYTGCMGKNQPKHAEVVGQRASAAAPLENLITME